MVALAALLLSPVSAGQWLQSGFDATNSANALAQGPTSDDVAFTLVLPRPANTLEEFVQEPLVHDGFAYVVGVTERWGPAGLDNRYLNATVYRIDLATTTLTALFVAHEKPRQLLSDGERIYFVGETRAEAYDIKDGRLIWRKPIGIEELGSSPLTFAMGAPACGHSRIAEGRLYVGCNDNFYGYVYLRVFDAKSGVPIWSWVRETDAKRFATPPRPNYQSLYYGQVAPRPDALPWVEGLAVLGDHVFLVTRDQVTQGSLNAPAVRALYAINTTTRTVEWARSGQANQDYLHKGDASPNGLSGQRTNLASPPTGNATIVFVEFDRMYAFNVQRPQNEAAPQDIRRGGLTEGDTASGLAFDGTHVFALTRTSLHRMTGSLEILKSLDLPATEAFGEGPPILTAECTLARSFPHRGQFYEQSGDPNTIHCLDPDDMSVRWTVSIARQSRFSVAGQAMLVSELGGRFTVFGTVPAALQIGAPKVSTLYPQPGDQFRVDLSGTKPGAFGPATEYRAVWGDGQESEWQSSPVLVHEYAFNAEAVARVWARNEAGQTTSAELAVHVGRIDPALSPLEVAFLPRYAESTYFILGIIATTIFAVAGILRYRVRHSRLQRELRAIDEMFAVTQSDPPMCERRLMERRAHARELLRTRKLDDSSCQTLERRIDELHRIVRLKFVDERMGYLPYSLVKRLQAVMEDGMVSAFERDHLFELIRADQSMEPRQKIKIRDLVQEWFGRDEERTRALVRIAQHK